MDIELKERLSEIDKRLLLIKSIALDLYSFAAISQNSDAIIMSRILPGNFDIIFSNLKKYQEKISTELHEEQKNSIKQDLMDLFSKHGIKLSDEEIGF